LVFFEKLVKRAETFPANSIGNLHL
jgi:hypothetical protein